jgi:hypothetical protein
MSAVIPMALSNRGGIAMAMRTELRLPITSRRQGPAWTDILPTGSDGAILATAALTVVLLVAVGVGLGLPSPSQMPAPDAASIVGP